jgi:hypothetical protein
MSTRSYPQPMGDSDGMTDQDRLLFGAGFVFGVAVTMLILGVVLAVVVSAGVGGVPTTVAATVAGGVLFAGIVGAGLYYLAFPDNRTRIAVDPAEFGLDDDEN